MPRTDRFEKPFKPIRETSVTDYFGEIGDTSGVWRINLESESSALGIEAVEFLFAPPVADRPTVSSY